MFAVWFIYFFIIVSKSRNKFGSSNCLEENNEVSWYQIKTKYKSVVLISTHNPSGLSDWCSHRHLYVRQLVLYSEMSNQSTILWTKQSTWVCFDVSISDTLIIKETSDLYFLYGHMLTCTGKRCQRVACTSHRPTWILRNVLFSQKWFI